MRFVIAVLLIGKGAARVFDRWNHALHLWNPERSFVGVFCISKAAFLDIV
jgi:hypothetical protein